MNKFGTAIAMTTGGGEEVPMWAEFRFEIGDRNPLFRVTSPARGQNGRRINGEFRFDLLAKARYNLKRNNYGRAGAMAVKKTIDEVGVERVLRAIKGYPDE